MKTKQSIIYSFALIFLLSFCSCYFIFPETDHHSKKPLRKSDEKKVTGIETGQHLKEGKNSKKCNQMHLFKPNSLDAILQTKTDTESLPVDAAATNEEASATPESTFTTTADFSFLDKEQLQDWLWENVRSRLIRNLWKDPNDYRALKLLDIEEYSEDSRELKLKVRLSWVDRWTNEKLELTGRLIFNTSSDNQVVFNLLKRNKKAIEFEENGRVSIPDNITLWLGS